MPSVTESKRKRSFFGWFIVAAFWGWQLLMGLWLLLAVSSTSDLYSHSRNAVEQAGTAIGATVGVMLILTIWVLISLLLGLMLLFTRGKTISITREVVDYPR
jgi:hypothetical protein